VKIQAKTSCDITAFLVKRNKSHDGKEGHVDIEIGVKQKDAADQFGADFEALAFATMQTVTGIEDGEKKIVFLQDTIKPGRRVMFERHVIQLDGEEIKEQPELLSIKTVDGDAKVIAAIRIPIETARKKLVSSLTQKVGEVVGVEFNPEQLAIPGTGT